MRFGPDPDWNRHDDPPDWLGHIKFVKSERYKMTTTVKVHVNGQYRATVKQDDLEPVIVEGNYNGGSGEKSFNLPHPAKATFEISEEYVADSDKRPAE